MNMAITEPSPKPISISSKLAEKNPAKPMWTGRFKTQTADLVRKYSESVSFDWRLYAYDIEGSIAHATALAAAGLISVEEKKQIEQGLLAIREEIERGEFSFDTVLEDIHMNIESALTKRIGEAGAKLHTARSRNDQIALDLRLYLRAETRQIQAALRQMQRNLLALAEQNPAAIMPGYTHLQRAQPVLFAHHLLAYVEMFERDFDRLEDSLKRIDVMPLGSGALAGSTLVLDRELIAHTLHFSAISRNSMDAVSDRDFACETISAVALTGVHLSRLSEDVILWASSEFRFVTIGDAFTTGSSLMPQKKNPDVAELTRGKTGRLIGNLVSLLTTLKGLPLTYNRDLQEDKEPIFDSVDTIKSALAVFAAMLLDIKVDADRMLAAANDPMLLATDLADYLVRRGVPFRQAHEMVGRLVALSIERKIDLHRLDLREIQSIAPMVNDDVFALFDPLKSLTSRSAIGAPSPENVLRELDRWKKLLAVPA
jgi:argininosuccinate lyase